MDEPAGDKTDSATKLRHRLAKRIQRVMPWGAAGLLIGISLVEWFQPDALAALTAIPPWCWLLLGLALGMRGFKGASRRVRCGLWVVLLVFAGLNVEQSWSLARSACDLISGAAIKRPTDCLRVVSLNCDVGRRAAAEEVARFQPDIVLFQETPGELTLQALAQAWFGSAGSVVCSCDCAIIARGQLQSAEIKAGHFVQATLTLPDGRVVEVFSLRLTPPVIRYDLWSPTCWTEHANVRRKHRQEAMEIKQALLGVPLQRPIVLGGDCNSPAGDGALRSWKPELVDAFATAGRGWGNTVLNAFPVHRFDQLWCGSGVEAMRVWSERTANSDHRMAIGDFCVPIPSSRD